jgi:hypothetical protein
MTINLNGKAIIYNDMKSLRESIMFDLRKCGKIIHSDMDSDYIFKNENQSKREVKEELSYKIGEQRYSSLFLNQLAILHEGGYITINDPFLNKVERAYYMLDDIYINISELVKGSSNIEQIPFEHEYSCLRGENLFHIHHNPMNYADINVVRYFAKKYQTDEMLIKDLELLDTKYHNKPINELINILVNSCFGEVSRCPDKVKERPFRITGEWLIYQRINDKYNFIGLYLHNKGDEHDRNLYELIRQYLV